MSHEGFRAGPEAGRLWAGILLPPAAFLVAVEAAYLLVPWACRHGQGWVVYLGLLPGLVLLAIAFLAVRQVRRITGGGPGDEVFGQGGDVALDPQPSRVRFMATVGLLSCVLFTVLLLGLAVPIVGHHPCD